jgi:hypothetical protein
MARIDAVAQVLSLYDVLYFLNPDTAKDTVANTFRKFIRAGKDLRRVHQLLKDEVGGHHLHTFPKIEEKDRPKPTWVVTSYEELHEFLGEYFARHPKTAERSYVFLDANREALQAIWGPEPEAWSAAKAVYPSIPQHVNQAFKHLGILPEQSSTPGIFTAVIPAALLPVIVAKETADTSTFAAAGAITLRKAKSGEQKWKKQELLSLQVPTHRKHPRHMHPLAQHPPLPLHLRILQRAKFLQHQVNLETRPLQNQ